MTGLRVLGSVGIAWTAWAVGHALIVWKGMDHLRSAMMRDGWSAAGILGLLAIVLGSCLLAAATLSLLLSWVGLFSVGVVQIVVAVATGFYWSPDLISTLVPRGLFTSLYSYHLYLGVHLALGAIFIGLSLAALLRTRSGARGTGLRLLSLAAVPCVVVATVVLAIGGGRNMRTLQTFMSVEALSVVLDLLAAALFAATALLSTASGSGVAAGGALLLMVGALGLLSPESFFVTGPSEFGRGWSSLASTGALFLLGLVVTVGGGAVSIAARLGAGPVEDRAAPHPTYPQTHQEF